MNDTIRTVISAAAQRIALEELSAIKDRANRMLPASFSADQPFELDQLWNEAVQSAVKLLPILIATELQNIQLVITDRMSN